MSAALRTGSVSARRLRCHADGFAARPAPRLLSAVEVRIGIGVARPFILAIRSGIEESAVARLLDHCLGQHGRCGQARQHSNRAKKFEGRHLVSSTAVRAYAEHRGVLRRPSGWPDSFSEADPHSGARCSASQGSSRCIHAAANERTGGRRKGLILDRVGSSRWRADSIGGFRADQAD